MALYPSRVRSNEMLDGTSLAIRSCDKCSICHAAQVHKVLPSFALELGANSSDLLG